MLWALSQWSVQELSPEPLLKCFEPTGGSTAQCKWTIVAPYQSGTHFKGAKLWSCSLWVHFTGTYTSGTSNPELRDNLGPVREWDLAQSWRHLPIITCHLPERSGHDPSFIQANRKFSPLYHFRSQGRHTCALSVFCILSSFLNPKETERWAYSQRLPWIITSLGNFFWFFGRQETYLASWKQWKSHQ